MLMPNRKVSQKTVADFFWSFLVLSLAGILLYPECSFPSSFPYDAAIAEGRSAVKEVMESTGASSVSLAFVDGERLVWAESFGLADRSSKAAPRADTMYGIGSTSKMLATIAVMKLVDQGKVSLDAPVADYIRSFYMLSPEYGQITIRMLLNHSSGFPGTDERNAETTSPLKFSFSAQVLETLRNERLKHKPGYLSAYCNDGFTIIEQLVSAVTGKSYFQFMHDEIFAPLGMHNSRYPLDYFPEGSFVKRYDKDNKALPQLFLNTAGSGGLYSTPTDLAKIAMMIIGKGKLGSVRILSEDAVSQTGIDQTLKSFNPVKADGMSFGLGWDTIRQPGLGAVGVIGWQKGGDIPFYGSVITVAPVERLAVVVTGASGSFGSIKATIIAERVLLAALVERGRIAGMPARLNLKPRPQKKPEDKFLDSVIGYYANNNTLLKTQSLPDGSLNILQYSCNKNKWEDWLTNLKMRDDDRFYSNGSPSRSISFKTADGRQYLIVRSVKGYGHYQDNNVFAQKVRPSGKLPGPWSRRLGKKWLLANEHPDFSDKWEMPVMKLETVDGMFFAGWEGLQIVDPSLSDSRAGMMLLIPQSNGNGLNDLVIEVRSGQEWVRYGSYLFRPAETIGKLNNGSNNISTGAEGLSQWRILDAAGTTKTVSITPASADGCWRIYDSSFKQVKTGKGTKSIQLSGGRYYMVFHGDTNVTQY